MLRAVLIGAITEPMTTCEISAKLGVAEAHVRTSLSGLYFMPNSKKVDPDRPLEVTADGRWYRR